MCVSENDHNTEEEERLNEIDSHGEQSVNSSTHIHKSKAGGGGGGGDGSGEASSQSASGKSTTVLR